MTPLVVWAFLSGLAGLAACLALYLVAAVRGIARDFRELSRAKTLRMVADDAAAAVVAQHAQAQYPNQLVMVQQQIMAAGLGVKDAKAIERAAAGALTRRVAAR